MIILTNTRISICILVVPCSHCHYYYMIIYIYIYIYIYILLLKTFTLYFMTLVQVILSMCCQPCNAKMLTTFIHLYSMLTDIIQSLPKHFKVIFIVEIMKLFYNEVIYS